MPNIIRPTYSHGGSGIESWPAVIGTVVGAGNPIEVFHGSGLNWPRIQLVWYDAPDMTVITQINPGPINELTGQPHPNHWFELGTDVVVATGGKSYSLPPDSMYVRTFISVRVAGTLESMVPALELPTGQKVMAQYPTIRRGLQI